MVAQAPFGGIAPDNGYWAALLSRSGRSALVGSGVLRRLPASPRCKLCRAPAAGIGGAIAGALGRRVRLELLLCEHCIDHLEERPGGAEIDASVIHADLRQIRLSTAPSALQHTQFLRLAAGAIERQGGILDCFRGNVLRAFFVSAIGGDGHAERAAIALAELFQSALDGGFNAAGCELSVGLASGPTWVGAQRGALGTDFTVAGATTEVATKLAAAASDGEALVAMESWRRHGGPVAKSRLRTVPLPGQLSPVEAVIIRGRMEATI